MGETVTVEFIGRRLDTIQNDQRDLRRRLIALTERFGAIEARFGHLEARAAIIEERLDELVDRTGRLEETQNRMLTILTDVARKLDA
jgi:predicted nuclease with TOPRIM domain